MNGGPYDAGTSKEDRAEAGALLYRARREGGRPSKLTGPIARRLVAAVREGMSVDQAAHLLLLAPSTVRGWLHRGQGALAAKDESAVDPLDLACLELCLALRCADAFYERELLKTITAAAKAKPELALSILERRNPARYAKKSEAAAQPAAIGEARTVSQKTLSNFKEQIGLKPQPTAKADDDGEPEDAPTNVRSITQEH